MQNLVSAILTTNFSSMNFFQSTLGRFRLVALAEGVSYLILLFIAMPLKYVWGLPQAVRAFGSIHGLLFVLYMLLLLLCMIEYRWTFKKIGLLILLSMIPFGAFYADRRYLQPEQQ
jgi:integral membrane protein